MRDDQVNTNYLSWLALILSIASIICAVVAIQSSNNNTTRLDGQQSKINALTKEVKLLDRPATTGAGVGPNDGTQVVPNGSGQ
jgi:hypothetical protein